jgi:hypothetical protein
MTHRITGQFKLKNFILFFSFIYQKEKKTKSDDSIDDDIIQQIHQINMAMLHYHHMLHNHLFE